MIAAWAKSIYLVLAVCTALGLVENHTDQIDEQAIEAISRLEGSYERDILVEGNPIASVDLSTKPISNADLRIINELSHLTKLSLSATPITDKGLLQLSKLTRLRDIDLENTKITNGGLIQFVQGKQLHHLRLAACRDIADVGVLALAGQKAIRSLDLRSTAITNESLGVISSLTSLEELALGGTNISEWGVMYLVRLKRLKTLDVGDMYLPARTKRILSEHLPDCEIFDAFADN